jgi:hypothetical protein
MCQRPSSIRSRLHSDDRGLHPKRALCEVRMSYVTGGGAQGRRPVTNLVEPVRGGLSTGRLVGIDEQKYDGASGSRRRTWTGLRRGADAADRMPGSVRSAGDEPMGGTEA